MSWKQVKLGAFLKVRDNRFKPNDKAIADLKRIDKIDFSGEIFISDKPSNTDMILIKKGDLVISGINVEKGAMAVYNGEDDITATIHYSSYSFDENTTDIEFLKSFLKSIEFKNALKEQVPGGIKTEIKPKHLLPLIVEIPTDIRDQREVVKLLQSRNSKLYAISSELTHQLDLVKKLRQQLLQDAVQGKLVEQNPKDEPASELLKRIKAEKAKSGKKEKPLPPIKPEEIPFEIPKNWEWCRLGKICDYEQGIQVDVNLQKSTPDDNLIRFLRIVDYTQETDELRYVKSPGLKYLIGEDELVMVRYGATAGFVGSGKSGILANNLFKIKYGSLSKSYLMYFFKSKYFNSELSQNTKGVAMPAISFKFLDSLAFPLPPLAEQNRIVQKLDELMQYCNELEASIKQSESQNEKLLQQVLREALRKEPVDA